MAKNVMSRDELRRMRLRTAGDTPGAGGGVAPPGFQLLTGADGAQLLGADGAPLYGKAA